MLLLFGIAKKRGFLSARDPFGIKPLYVGYNVDGVILSSQVKTLLSTKYISTDKDTISQFSFWNLGYVIEPRTWYKNIKALKSGHSIHIKDGKIISELKWYDVNKIGLSLIVKNKKIQKKLNKTIKH